MNLTEQLNQIAAPSKAALKECWLENANGILSQVTEEMVSADQWYLWSKEEENSAARGFFIKVVKAETRTRKAFRMNKGKVEMDENGNGIFDLVEVTVNIVKGYRKPTAAELEANANEYAEETWSVWLNKMLAKLSKTNIVSFEYFAGNNPLENIFTVTSANGLEFTVSNSIEISVSSKGRLFNRFPCRFHNPIMNGEKVKNCSSQKKIIELANA